MSISVAGGKRIAEVLVEESTIVNPENPIYEVKDGSIEFKNVSFKYSENAEKTNNINIENAGKINNTNTVDGENNNS